MADNIRYFSPEGEEVSEDRYKEIAAKWYERMKDPGDISKLVDMPQPRDATGEEIDFKDITYDTKKDGVYSGTSDKGTKVYSNMPTRNKPLAADEELEPTPGRARASEERAPNVAATSYNYEALAKKYGTPSKDWISPSDRIRMLDRDKFEKVLQSKMGGNPYMFDPQVAVNESEKNLPALFAHVFRNRIPWSERDRLMTGDQRKYWETVKKEYLQDKYYEAKSKQEVAINRYKNAMSNYDKYYAQQLKRAKEIEAYLKEMRGAERSILKEGRAEERQIVGEQRRAGIAQTGEERRRLAGEITVYKDGQEKTIQRKDLAQAESEGWGRERPRWKPGTEKGTMSEKEALRTRAAIFKELRALDKPDADLEFAKAIGIEVDTTDEESKADYRQALLDRLEYTEKFLPGVAKEQQKKTEKDEVLNSLIERLNKIPVDKRTKKFTDPETKRSFVWRDGSWQEIK